MATPTKSRTFSIQIVLASNRGEDRATLERILAGSAWNLVAAETAESAALALRQVKFPIVICDPLLVGPQRARRHPQSSQITGSRAPFCGLALRSDGQATLRKLLTARRGTYPVLLIDPEDARADRAAAPGAFDWLIRPLDRDAVFRALFFAYARCRIRWPAGILARAKNETSPYLEPHAV